MYRVIEVARLLGVSKVTIYKKMELHKKQLRPFLKYRSNIAYLEEGGVDILRNTLQLHENKEESECLQVNNYCEEQVKTTTETDCSELNRVYDQFCNDMLQQLDFMDHLIKKKKDEIQQKEQLLKKLQNMVKWNSSSDEFVEKISSYFLEKNE